MPGRRPRHIRKSARNDAQCGDLKKRPSPQRDLAKSLFLSSMHAKLRIAKWAQIWRVYGADVKKYPFKGGLFTSPEASRPPDRRAQSAQSVPSSQFPRGPRPRAPSLALPSMFARWRPGDLHLRRNVLSRPLSRPLPIFFTLHYSHAKAAQTLLL